jgi:hypothetical protein
LSSPLAVARPVFLPTENSAVFMNPHEIIGVSVNAQQILIFSDLFLQSLFGVN